jgi:hypothetical protein
MRYDSNFRWQETAAPRHKPERTPWLLPDWLDAERDRMEAGPGGDLDAGERLSRTGRTYVPGLKRTVSTWLRLYERVQRGELGGALDGVADRQCPSTSLVTPSPLATR